MQTLDALRTKDITTAKVLELIADGKERTGSEIAERCSTSKSEVITVLNRLTNLGALKTDRVYLGGSPLKTWRLSK